METGTVKALRINQCLGLIPPAQSSLVLMLSKLPECHRFGWKCSCWSNIWQTRVCTDRAPLVQEGINTLGVPTASTVGRSLRTASAFPTLPGLDIEKGARIQSSKSCYHMCWQERQSGESILKTGLTFLDFRKKMTQYCLPFMPSKL
jgi:hypothetical protein